MRMTGFIAGSLLGMVGAFALMKKKPGMAKAMQNVIGDMKGNIMSVATSKFTNSKQEQQGNVQQAASGQASNKAKQNQSSSSSSSSNHQMNRSMIEGIIKSDPELQSAVNEIKSETKSIQH